MYFLKLQLFVKLDLGFFFLLLMMPELFFFSNCTYNQLLIACSLDNFVLIKLAVLDFLLKFLLKYIFQSIMSMLKLILSKKKKTSKTLPKNFQKQMPSSKNLN